MKYRKLGRSGLFVSEICLGTMNFGANPGRYAAAGWLLQDDAERIVARALDAGVNFFDTANVYGGQGGSETILGQSLKNLGVSRDQVVISTKVEGAMGSGANDGGASRFHIMDQAKASLRRLNTDHIDLYQIHAFDQATPIEETLRALDDLVRQGHVRYLGISNWAAWQVSRALGVADNINVDRFVGFQGQYSLVGRDIERDIVPMLDAEGLGLIVWGPLAGGYLTGKYRLEGAEGRRKVFNFPPVDEDRGAELLTTLDRLAETRNTTVAAVALSWLLHKRTVASVIVGARNTAQLDDNLASSGLSLTSDDMNTLDGAFELVLEYPGNMALMHGIERRKLLETGQLPSGN
ncbi:Predicted oxidoreductase [Devosia sp. YR412]|uniref:aldo/keto reductase n=1 Tax=Devosia sp. YR412 TaxID=1881030 RepID=UPI0008CE4C55|nr:aldo/keto reductase [Devosia sp. YR412]SEQ10294.1 Predicted oxidoreductase [Devosia sp. YR412]